MLLICVYIELVSILETVQLGTVPIEVVVVVLDRVVVVLDRVVVVLDGVVVVLDWFVVVLDVVAGLYLLHCLFAPIKFNHVWLKTLIENVLPCFSQITMNQNKVIYG
jgi:hypothetical protein